MSAKKLKFLIAGFVIVGSFIYLGISGFKSDNLVYFLTVDEVAAKGPGFQNQGVRVEGKLVPKTLVREPGAMKISFRLQGETRTLLVQFKGVPPDLLENGMPIIAEGKLDDKGVLVAKNLMVACPSKFEERKEAGESIPEDHKALVNESLAKKANTAAP